MIDTLFFDGGGCYGVSLIGAIKALGKTGILNSITAFKGTSVGSIFALLLTLGYKPEEIQDVIMKMDFEKVYSFKRMNILKYGHYGNPDYLINYIRTAIKIKFDENITFKELYEKTGKTLEVNTVCLCDNKPVYFSHVTHPNTQVLLAIQMSVSIPYVFPFVEYKDKLYTDGGICQLPIHMYDEKTHLIFQYKSTNASLERKDKLYEVKQIIQTIGRFKYNNDNIINIPIQGLHSLSVPTEVQKLDMIKSGLITTYEHIKEHQLCPYT